MPSRATPLPLPQPPVSPPSSAPSPDDTVRPDDGGGGARRRHLTRRPRRRRCDRCARCSVAAPVRGGRGLAWRDDDRDAGVRLRADARARGCRARALHVVACPRQRHLAGGRAHAVVGRGRGVAGAALNRPLDGRAPVGESKEHRPTALPRVAAMPLCVACGRWSRSKAETSWTTASTTAVADWRVARFIKRPKPRIMMIMGFPINPPAPCL